MGLDKMDAPSIIAVLTVMGGGFAWLWNAMQTRAKDQKEELLAKIQELTTKISNCEGEKAMQNTRISALEASLKSEAPTWRRTRQGMIISASPSFVRLMMVPFGYGMSDVVMKNLKDLERFPRHVIEALEGMDAEVHRRGAAVRSHIEVVPGTKVTIMKVASYDATGDLVYVGYAVEE